MKTGIRSILLIKPSSLGDIVHALPTAAALRRAFPSASLAWLIKRQWAEVLEGNPHLDRVLAVDLSVAGWPAAIRAVRASRFDLVVDLQGLLRSAFFAWVSGAPARIGFANAREGSRWLYTKRVPVDDTNTHAVDRYLLLARAAGASLDDATGLKFPLPTDPVAEARVSSILRAEGVSLDTPLVALNAGARWRTKQWPPALFAEVGDRLQQDGVRIVLIGEGAEPHPADAVLQCMRTRPINLVRRTSIKELIGLLRRLRVLITNDSGPMHLAAALGTPLIALFGPTDPVRTGPFGAAPSVLMSNVPCRPCMSRRCVNPNDLECLWSITPTEVVRQALAILHADSHDLTMGAAKSENIVFPLNQR